MRPATSRFYTPHPQILSVELYATNCGEYTLQLRVGITSKTRITARRREVEVIATGVFMQTNTVRIVLVALDYARTQIKDGKTKDEMIECVAAQL